MKLSTYSILFVAALMMFACGGSNNDSPEAKRKMLEQYRKEVAGLQAQIAVLETELNANADKSTSLRLIETLTTTPETFAHFVEVQGNVVSDKNVMVHPEANGVLLRRMVEEGAMVSQGQAIAEVDAEVIKRNIAEMETRYELAKTIYERQANLWNQKIGSEVQYLQSKNNMEALQKSIEAMKTQLNRAVVRAPISGRLDEFFVNVGEMANPGAPLARIVNISEVQIHADVSEAYLKSIRTGDMVTVKFPALEKELELKVFSTGQFINANNRTFKVQMKASNPDGQLKPNMLAVVKLKDYEAKNAIAIPTYLIQQSASGERFVYAVRNSSNKKVVERVVVKTGISYEGKTEVTEGINAGDILVTKGYNEVINGEEVRINTPAQSSSSTQTGSKS